GAGRVQGPADDVVANAGEILHTAAADEHDRVLLQVVSLARDVARDLHLVGQADAAHLPERRVRLLRRRGVHANADAPPLGAGFEGGGRRLVTSGLAALANELADGRHGRSLTRVEWGRR